MAASPIGRSVADELGRLPSAWVRRRSGMACARAPGRARWGGHGRRVAEPHSALPDAATIDQIITNLIVAAGACVQSTVGFGFALVAVPFLLMVDPSLVPGPFLLASLLLATLMIRRDRSAIDLSEVRPAVIGLVAGTAVGAGALLFIDEAALPRLFAALILLAVAGSVLGLHIRISGVSLLAAGTVGGVMGTMAGIHGPAMALLYQSESGGRVRGSLGVFFLAGYAISIGGLAAVGLFGRGELMAGLALVPGTTLGWLLAPLAIARLDPSHLRPLILAVGAAAALVMLVRG